MTDNDIMMMMMICFGHFSVCRGPAGSCLLVKGFLQRMRGLIVGVCGRGRGSSEVLMAGGNKSLSDMANVVLFCLIFVHRERQQG